MNKVPTFAVSNDTNKHIVIVDGYYQAFDSKAEAQAVYDLVFRVKKEAQILESKKLSIDETPFGAFSHLPPHETCWHMNFDTRIPYEVSDKISSYKPIDLLGYVKKQWYRWDKGLNILRNAEDPLTIPLHERLEWHRRNKELNAYIQELFGRPKKRIRKYIP